MRVVLAVWLFAVATAVAVPALAAETPAQPVQSAVQAPARVQKRVTAAHYPTLEKMLRRFSRQAGEARTRG